MLHAILQLEMRIASFIVSFCFVSLACKSGEATVAPGSEHGDGAEHAAATADVDPNEHAFFDAEGQEASFDAFVSDVADVDLVAFGELHYHSVGSRYEFELLQRMAAQDRPVALAMEFFEADVQPALDDYLAGRIEESEFRERTRQGENYDESHRPLIEFCKEHRIPVIAANAPRPLVKNYRKSGLSYDEYLAGLNEEERAQLPRRSVPPEDEFKRRFIDLMGPRRGPAFFVSMALWNDSMAESIADFRAAHEDHRVLLIVGGFHVAAHLGTITQYAERRPKDTSKVLLMQVLEEGPVAFSEDFRGEADVLLGVRMPTDG